MSARDQLPNDWDLQVIDKEVRLSMEFDFKRRPVQTRMFTVDSHNIARLVFSTVPRDIVEERELVRVLFDQWRRGDGKDKPGHCLKTLVDWHEWQHFQQLYMGNRRRRQAYQARLEAGDGVPSLPSDLIPASGGRLRTCRQKATLRVSLRRADRQGFRTPRRREAISGLLFGLFWLLMSSVPEAWSKICRRSQNSLIG